MASTHSLFVSLGSFGASEVRRHGQAWFIRLCHAAGADGVEIRGELLNGTKGELQTLAATVRDTNMACVYSSPAMLWNQQGKLELETLEQGLHIAGLLGATVLKMSIGQFTCAADPAFPALAERLTGRGISLLIENDQTECAGTVPALQRFFQAADQAGVTLGMTFDMGNWHWNGECPVHAAMAFAARVRYVHCKGVQRRPDRWVAVPLVESSAAWRAILRAMPQGVPRAIEYPLVGDDLLSVTRDAIQQLRNLENS